MSEVGGSQYTWLEMPDGTERRLSKEERANPSLIPMGAKVFAPSDASSSHDYSLGKAPVDFRGRLFHPGGRYWSTSPQGIRRITCANRFVISGKTLFYKRYLDDFPVFPLTNMWRDTSSSFAERLYVVQSTTKVVERCILMTTDPGDLVLDPTCGSGTTAYVAEQWGRRWITIDTSRVALTLARTRLMAARFPYYYLADDHPQIAQMTTEEEIKYHLRKSAKSVDSSSGDVRKGFIYRRVPHITLKSIANNEEIDTIHARWQPQLDEALARLNAALRGHKAPFAVTEGGRAGHEVRFDAPDRETFTMPSGQVVKVCELVEWEVPRQAPKDWPAAARRALEKFWELRRERQKEIDASIQRRAEYETLYDQPYEDTRRVRVAGPFTVESLSPHRTISVEEKRERAETPRDWGADGAAPPRTLKVLGPDDFGRMILDNLRTAGVQTGKKQERLRFETLEPYAGQWIHGRGEYVEQDGTRKRAAICIGPEHGTVGPELVKEAAKEAVQGVGFDVLVVCGFAFDPHVSEEARRYGKLVVLPCRMNPDLAMGDLLKKTGSANLFMVFGEPDVVVDSDQWIVDRNGRRVMRYGRLARLSGFGSVEEINRAGQAGLSALRKLARAGEVPFGVADAEGGGFGGSQHRRGRRAERNSGVPPLSGDRPGVGRRVGDPASVDQRVGPPAGRSDSSAPRGTDDCPQDALSPDEVAALESLTPASLPLSTIHQVQVTIRGVDVYDPTTGEIRSSSTDDIACWFLDTNYNGESFFVRHAYFTGADQPYEKLKRALRAEIDEAAWSALYSTVSRPFPRPETGKIAVKVINHYGDEVLKVYQI